MITKVQFYKDYFLILLLFIFSGSPIGMLNSVFSKTIFVCITLILLLVAKKKINKIFGYSFINFFLFSLGLLIFQYLTIQDFSFGALGFIVKMIFGISILALLNYRIIALSYNFIFFISLTSLIFLLLDNLGVKLPAIYTIPRTNDYINNMGLNYIIYHIKGDGLRNCGMFWEPGAFACYILIVFSFQTGGLKRLFRQNKVKFLTILLALITTYSTTGYLVFSIILSYSIIYHSFSKYKLLIFTVIIPLFFAMNYIFENSKFLETKIAYEYDKALALNGEFDGGRFSALFFDFHYILKHPLVGNGFHLRTRYQDHPQLANEILGHGNGFSNFLAQTGFLLFFYYLTLIYKFSISNKFFNILIFIMLLQGEPLMNFPFFIVLPFIYKLNNEKHSSIINMS